MTRTIAPYRSRPFLIVLAALLVTPIASPQTAAALTPRQKAALEKACSTGTLTPEECAAKGLNAVSAAPSGTGRAYKDPKGRYSLVIPDGWNSSNQGDVLSLTNGQSWMQIIGTTGTTAQDAANTQANNFHTAFSAFTLLSHGAPNINGRESWGMNFDATSAKTGEKLSVLFIAQSAGNNHFLTIVSCTPVAQAGPTNGAAMQMADSVKF